MNRTDVFILVIILFIAGLIAFLTFQPKGNDTDTAKYVSIQVDGREIDRRSLDPARDEEIIVHGHGGENHIHIQKGKVDMVEADCPDQICVHTKPIEQVGERIICLPHRVMIEIRSDSTERVIDATVF